MVYLNKTSGSITLPKYYNVGGEYTLTLTNNLGKQVYTFDNLTDISELDYYYTFEISVSDMPTGEYNLSLKCGDFEVLVGMVTIGDYKRSNKEYEHKNTFIQYGDN
jgi:hypothetical protein